MQLIIDLFKVILFSLLFLIIFMLKLIRKFLNWGLIFTDWIMTFGGNNLDNEMNKLRISIIDIFKKNYQKIVK